MVSPITAAEVERWRQLSDELSAQSKRLQRGGITSRNEWEATIDLAAAARHLWGAASWMLLQREAAR